MKRLLSYPVIRQGSRQGLHPSWSEGPIARRVDERERRGPIGPPSFVVIPSDRLPAGERVRSRRRGLGRARPSRRRRRVGWARVRQRDRHALPYSAAAVRSTHLAGPTLGAGPARAISEVGASGAAGNAEPALVRIDADTIGVQARALDEVATRRLHALRVGSWRRTERRCPQARDHGCRPRDRSCRSDPLEEGPSRDPVTGFLFLGHGYPFRRVDRTDHEIDRRLGISSSAVSLPPDLTVGFLVRPRRSES